MQSFDIQKAIDASGLPSELIEEILQEAAAEYPDRGALYELRVVRSLHAELRQRMGPDAWQGEMRQAVRKMLDEHGYELASEPAVIVERQRSKRAKAS